MLGGLIDSSMNKVVIICIYSDFVVLCYVPDAVNDIALTCRMIETK